MRGSRKKKKVEFSKVMIVVAGIINITVIVFTFIMIERTNDLTPLCYLIPAVAAEVATGSAFYYRKAESENQIKLNSIYGQNKHGGEEESADHVGE